jgi:hypothetical protein
VKGKNVMSADASSRQADVTDYDAQSASWHKGVKAALPDFGQLGKKRFVVAKVADLTRCPLRSLILDKIEVRWRGDDQMNASGFDLGH